MDKLKALKEERNDLFNKGQELVSVVEKENRSLNAGEAENLKSIQTKINKIDNTVNLMTEQRNIKDKVVKKEKAKKEIRKDPKPMNKQEHIEAEKRALETYLRTGQDAELRSVTADYKEKITDDGVNGNGGVTIPTYINDNIVQLLTEDAPILEAVQKFSTPNGNLKVLREDSTSEAGFVGEEQDLTDITDALKTVTLSGKRAGAAIQLTQQLINDSAIGVVDYATQRLVRALAKALERAILVGTKDPVTSFKPIVGDKDVQEIKMNNKDDVANMLDVFQSINPAYLKGAKMIVSRPAFNKLTELQDGNKQYLIFRGDVDKTPGYSFLGIPVYVSDVLNDASQDIVFGNFNSAYGLLERKGLHLTNVSGDTKQAMAGGQLIVLDGYFDGAVINPKAVVTASFAKK